MKNKVSDGSDKMPKNLKIQKKMNISENANGRLKSGESKENLYVVSELDRNISKSFAIYTPLS